MIGSAMSSPQSVIPDQTPLRSRAVVAARWVLASHAAEQTLAILRITILARLLNPRDFGVMGMAALMLSAVETASHPALDAVLVRERWTPQDLNTAWTLTVARSIAVAALMWLFAPLLAAFFSVPLLVPLGRILALSVLMRGAANLEALATFASELRFSRVTAMDLAGMTTNTVVAIGLALIWPSVWALALGVVAGEAGRTVASYLLCRERPGLGFSWPAAKRLLAIGRWFTGNNVLIFLALHLDDVVVGRMLGSGPLGLYQVAYRISNLPATSITHVANRVAFPIYAQLRDHASRLEGAVRQVTQAVSTWATLLAVLLVVGGPDLARVLLGPSWTGAGPAIQVLGVFGLVRALAGCFGVVIQAVGTPRALSLITGAQLLLMGGLLVVLVPRFSIIGAAYAATAGIALSLVLAARYGLGVLGWSVREYAGIVGRPVAAGAAGAAVGLLLRLIMGGQGGIGRLLILAGVSGAAYLAAAVVVARTPITSAVRPGTLLRWHALRHVLRAHVSGAVIDIGGRDGWILSRLQVRGIVLEPDETAVRQAERAGHRAVVGMGDRLPFRDGSVQTVLCLDTIEHVAADAALFGECARVLRPGGKLVLTTPRHDMHLAPFVDMPALEQVWGHLRRGYTGADLIALCRRYGLDIVMRGAYFNAPSRWLYAALFVAGPGRRLPLAFRLAAIQCAGTLEPFLHWRRAEHVLVAQRPA